MAHVIDNASGQSIYTIHVEWLNSLQSLEISIRCLISRHIAIHNFSYNLNKTSKKYKN